LSNAAGPAAVTGIRAVLGVSPVCERRAPTSALCDDRQRPSRRSDAACICNCL
jgi:hypothetical protein